MLNWLRPGREKSAPAESGPDGPHIHFRCAPEDLDVIAPPVAARHVLPQWFKRLPAVDRETLSATDNGLTVKRCMPFLDAMTAGWVIPLAATVRLELSEAGTRIDAGWDFDKEMVSPHGTHQVAGHPRLPTPPMKFHNYWTIVTPPGWSCLFLPPLNRPQPAFEVASGIVDTDEYRSLIHFPFFATGGDGVHVIEQGTPIVQVIPFRRDASALAMTADIRALSREEALDGERIRRSTKAAEGWYRTDARAPR